MPGGLPLQYPFPYKNVFGEEEEGGGGTTASVSTGGTGNNSFTAYDVLVGNGIDPIIGVPPTTATYVLTSNGPTALPTFQPSSGGGGGGTVTTISATSTKPDVSATITNPTTTPALTIAYSGTPNPITEGGTNATTKNQAFTNLAPTSALGTTLIGVAGAGGYVALPVGSNGQVLTADSTQTNGVAWESTGTGSVESVGLSTTLGANPATVLSVVSASTPVTGTGTLELNYSGTALPIPNGGTNATTAYTAFNNLAPTTAVGGLIVGSGSSTYANLPVGSNNQVLISNSSSTDGVEWANASEVLQNAVAFSAQTASTQSIANTTATKVTTWTVDLDSATGWSSANSYYVVPFSGFYYVCAQIIYSSFVGAYDAEVQIYHNGSLYQSGVTYHPALTAIGNPISQTVINCAQGDTIAIYAYQDSGSSIALGGTGSQAQTSFTIASVGGTASGSSGSGTVTSVGTAATTTGLTLVGGPITGSGTITLEYTGAAIPILNGGTSGTTADAGFNNLAPSSRTGGGGVKGDLIVYNGSDNVKIPAGPNGYLLASESSTATGLEWINIGSQATPTVFQATTSSVQTISTATSTQVTSWLEAIDTGSGWNNTSQYYIIPTTGYYNVQATVNLSSSYSAYDAQLYIVKNGSTIIQEGNLAHAPITADASPIVFGLFLFNTNDTVQINVYQASGQSIALSGTSAITNFVITNVVNFAGGSGGGGTVTSVGLQVPPFLVVSSGNPVTSAGTLVVSYSGSALPIANGGTAGTTAITAFNNLAPVTSTGGMIVANGTDSYINLPAGTSGQILEIVTGVPSWNTTLSGAYNFSSTTGLTFNGPLFMTAGLAGASGQVLTSTGAGSVPVWSSVGNILITNNTFTGTNTFNNTVTTNSNTTLSNSSNTTTNIAQQPGSTVNLGNNQNTSNITNIQGNVTNIGTSNSNSGSIVNIGYQTSGGPAVVVNSGNGSSDNALVLIDASSIEIGSVPGSEGSLITIGNAINPSNPTSTVINGNLELTGPINVQGELEIFEQVTAGTSGVGTAGYVLTSQGTGAPPLWQSLNVAWSPTVTPSPGVTITSGAFTCAQFGTLTVGYTLFNGVSVLGLAFGSWTMPAPPSVTSNFTSAQDVTGTCAPSNTSSGYKGLDSNAQLYVTISAVVGTTNMLFTISEVAANNYSTVFTGGFQIFAPSI